MREADEARRESHDRDAIRGKRISTKAIGTTTLKIE